MRLIDVSSFQGWRDLIQDEIILKPAVTKRRPTISLNRAVVCFDRRPAALLRQRRHLVMWRNGALPSVRRGGCRRCAEHAACSNWHLRACGCRRELNALWTGLVWLTTGWHTELASGWMRNVRRTQSIGGSTVVLVHRSRVRDIALPIFAAATQGL